jgi:hypothetical protein
VDVQGHSDQFDRVRRGTGHMVGLLLDCDAGRLTVEKNGGRLGVAITGLTGELCWALTLSNGHAVRFRTGPSADT